MRAGSKKRASANTKADSDFMGVIQTMPEFSSEKAVSVFTIRGLHGILSKQL
jgi:hypothetical protein